MRKLIDILMGKAEKFSVLDFALLKTCVGMMGILIGAYHSKACKKMAPLLWAGTLGTFVAIIYRMFLKPAKEDTSIYE
ncbi:MAG: hypothetical protein EOM76_11725 [Sphingobacteriia bacterium]|nr:hypothetical protein [Sphingobacteriia bacterium]